MAAAVESNAPTSGGSRPMTPSGQRDEAPLPPVPAGDGPVEELDPAYRERLQHVLSSDIGMNTLLNRLKQSISSTRDFAAFLKERSILEEKHAQGLKRLSRSTHDSIGRPESRQGSFAHNYRELTSIHERMADHGLQFSNALVGMSDELQELAANTERGRKHWKQSGLNAEKRVQEAEAAMDKAKHRYNSMAEQYDRARTGERQSGKFGLKKSGAQAEEDLRHKVEASDSDYAAKVQAAQSQRNDLQSTYRPQTVNALQELIRETDAGLSVHVQKFANLSEKMLLGFGLSVTPFKGQSPIPGQSSKSLREVASGINNERDFVDYVLSFSNKAPSRASEIKYEKHPSLSPKQQRPGYGEQYHNEDSYGQNYPPSHGRQVSGVTPYPGEGYGEESQHQGYGGPQQQRYPSAQGPGSTQQTGPSGAPQLPQISPTSGGRFNSEGGPISPIGSDTPGQPPAAEPSHVRNVSSVGSFGAPGQQYQSMQSPSSQPGLPTGQTGVGETPMGRGQAPIGLGQASQVLDRIQSHEAMGRGHSEEMGRGAAPSGSFGRGQAPLGAPVPQGGMYQGSAPQGGMYRGSSPQGGMTQGQPFQEGIGRGQGPTVATGRGQGPQGQMSQGQGPPLQSAMGRGALQSMERGAESQAFGRGQPHSGPGGMSQPPQQQGMLQQSAGRGMGLSPQPHSIPSQGAGRGMPGPNGPTNGAPRPGGVSALPSRQAVQRPGPPTRPVFGISLDDLFQREGAAVPTIVIQCVQAVEMYGLNMEGIYRSSGSANHVMELRQLFDHDATSVDLPNRPVVHDDIASVTTLLKRFLGDLPDPLLTSAQYRDFIQAAKVDEDVVRRDSIHALVNALPDPNYATLRVMAIHLHKIAQHSDRNKMTHNNLAIVFAPTLMGQKVGVNGNGPGSADIADSAWQAKVVETVLDNTFQIFDADE